MVMRAVGQREVEVAHDVVRVVAEGEAFCTQLVLPVAHPPRPARFVVASSQIRYGAPTAPVTTPVGSVDRQRVLRDEVGARAR